MSTLFQVNLRFRRMNQRNELSAVGGMSFRPAGDEDKGWTGYPGRAKLYREP